MNGNPETSTLTREIQRVGHQWPDKINPALQPNSSDNVRFKASGRQLEDTWKTTSGRQLGNNWKAIGKLWELLGGLDLEDNWALWG